MKLRGYWRDARVELSRCTEQRRLATSVSSALIKDSALFNSVRSDLEFLGKQGPGRLARAL